MKYRHYKGGVYELVCEAKLEANPTITMMIYRSLSDGMIWARPKPAFFETVAHEGKQVPRGTGAADRLCNTKINRPT